MPNPSCHWCGGETEPDHTMLSCRNKQCVAYRIRLTREMLEHFPVPCEMQVWVVEYIFQPQANDSEPIIADWLGYFATEELAIEGGNKTFVGLDGDPNLFEWEAVPTVLKFTGGA